MPHIHTEPGQHDLTVSAFIVNKNNEILLHKHKKYDRYLQPGGHVELDEDPWTAVLREIKEETGINPDDLQVYVPSMPMIEESFTMPTVFSPHPIATNTHPVGEDGHYHTDISYAFYMPPSTQMGEVGEGESTEFIWFRYPKKYETNVVVSRQVYRIPRNVMLLLHLTTHNVVGHWKLFPVALLGQESGYGSMYDERY